MLRPLDPYEPPPPPAYRVPWRIVRSDADSVIAHNESADELRHVVVTLLSTGTLLTPAARLVGPGRSVSFRFPRSLYPENDVALLAWTVSETQYLYRVVR